MKAVVHCVGVERPIVFEEIDVDADFALQERYGTDVPVLFVDGREAFEYRVSAAQLRRRLGAG